MLAQRISCCVSFVVGRPTCSCLQRTRHVRGVLGYLVSSCFQRHDGHRDGAGIMVAGEVAALVIDIVSGTFLAGFDGDGASAAFIVCGRPMISASWAVWRWPRSSSTSTVACSCCLAGSARRYAATALWARIAFRSPWFVAPYGAVPGALGNLTPVFPGMGAQAVWTCGFFTSHVHRDMAIIRCTCSRSWTDIFV